MDSGSCSTLLTWKSSPYICRRRSAEAAQFRPAASPRSWPCIHLGLYVVAVIVS